MKYLTFLLATEAALILSLMATNELAMAAGAREAQTGSSQKPPLANLDKMIRQANDVKIDAIVDGKLASNVTNALNDMALNLRKMLVENRRLTMQVQDVMQKLQNVTGLNATVPMGGLQQQAANMSNFNLSNLVARFSQ